MRRTCVTVRGSRDDMDMACKSHMCHCHQGEAESDMGQSIHPWTSSDTDCAHWRGTAASMMPDECASAPWHLIMCHDVRPMCIHYGTARTWRYTGHETSAGNHAVCVVPSTSCITAMALLRLTNGHEH